MKLLWCWAVTLSILIRYAFYRIGIGRRPLFTDHWDQVEVVYRQITRMDSRIRVRNAEHCPKQHPAVYAGNHTKLDDPFFVCYAVQEASNYTMHTRFVMRDDFFDGFPWNWLPFSMNEIAEMGGSYNISQKSASIAQLRPLIDMLLTPDSFVIFPGGGRSMTGLWMESHVGDEPGSMAFFVAQAQRKDPSLSVPAVPVGRTYNPIKNVSAVIVGKPRYLEHGARRDAQRAFDEALFTDISDLVEIHTLHVLCGILYFRCHHQRVTPLALNTLEEQCRKVLEGMEGHYLDPALPAALNVELPHALRYLQLHRMLTFDGERIAVDRDAILADCRPSPRFRIECPVQYHVNQIVHFEDVMALVEDTVLDPSPTVITPG